MKFSGVSEPTLFISSIGIQNTEKDINISILNTDMQITYLVEQNPWWKEKEKIERDYDIIKWKEKRHKWVPNIVNKIDSEPFSFHILLGPRQAGKTTAMKLLIKRLLEKEDPKGIFYFNCEELGDYREVLELIETYLEFKEDNKIKNSFLILDEVTSAHELYKAIKSLIDKGKLKNETLLITGSSSLSIKREIELFPGRRGKGEDLVLMPLSFRQFLNVTNPDL